MKKCKPHLHIPGILPTPTRFHTSGGPRRSLNLAVFNNRLGGTFIVEATGTAYKGYVARKKYVTKKGNTEQAASRITGPEYLDAVKAAWRYFNKVPAFRSVAASATLVHDKGKHHVSAAVTEGLKGLGLTALVQPARSPDLMPLDYGIFGTARRELERRGLVHADWESRVKAIKQILRDSPARATIDQFPLRVKACIECNGQHFEDKLRMQRGA